MADIVDRLRERSYGTKAKDPLCEVAANEIVMLREMLEKAAQRLAALSPFSIDLDTMTIVSEEESEDEDNRIYISSQHGHPDK
jgi:hypothetical protein